MRSTTGGKNEQNRHERPFSVRLNERTQHWKVARIVVTDTTHILSQGARTHARMHTGAHAGRLAREPRKKGQLRIHTLAAPRTV